MQYQIGNYNEGYITLQEVYQFLSTYQEDQSLNEYGRIKTHIATREYNVLNSDERKTGCVCTIETSESFGDSGVSLVLAEALRHYYSPREFDYIEII